MTLAYDFARVYATVDNDIIPAMYPNIPSIEDQVQIWNSNLASKPSYAKWTSANSVFAVYVGTNDIGNTFGEPDTMQTKLSAAQTRLFELLGSLYAAGARKFLLLHVPREFKVRRTCHLFAKLTRVNHQ